MSGFYGQFLNTIGMEYESSAFLGKYVKNYIHPIWAKQLGNLVRNITIFRDASTEFIAEPIKVGNRTIYVSSHTPAARKYLNAGKVRPETMGFELFTNPLEVEEFEKVVYPMLSVLESNGDYTSRRNSVHFHIGFANNLRLLKNLLHMCLSLDPVLYRMGGMGDTFRGNINLAAYARPLMNSVAVPVYSAKKQIELLGVDEFSLANLTAKAREAELRRKEAQTASVDGKLVMVINPLAALDARTIDEFWAAFGVFYPGGGGNKYHPSRYSGCNFFAVASHSTMEFRHFNQSLNSRLLIAIAKFLRATVELASTMSKAEAQTFDIINPNVEISLADSIEIMQKILGMCIEKEIENLPTEREMTIMYQNLENSHFEPLPDLPVMTHIKDFGVDSYTASRGKLLVVKKALDEQHVDIHNIAEHDVSIFD